jgi:hypothetical protein
MQKYTLFDNTCEAGMIFKLLRMDFLNGGQGSRCAKIEGKDGF